MDYIAYDENGKELLRVTHDPQGRVAVLFPLDTSVVLATDGCGIWLSLENTAK